MKSTLIGMAALGFCLLNGSAFAQDRAAASSTMQAPKVLHFKKAFITGGGKPGSQKIVAHNVQTQDSGVTKSGDKINISKMYIPLSDNAK